MSVSACCLVTRARVPTLGWPLGETEEGVWTVGVPRGEGVEWGVGMEDFEARGAWDGKGRLNGNCGAWPLEPGEGTRGRGSGGAVRE